MDEEYDTASSDKNSQGILPQIKSSIKANLQKQQLGSTT